MPIEATAPPVDRPIRTAPRSYSQFLDRVREAQGEWLSLPIEEISGAKPATKQVAILRGAAVRGFKVQTTIQEGRLYARRVDVIPPRKST
jgi:hypothetical protein